MHKLFFLIFTCVVVFGGMQTSEAAISVKDSVVRTNTGHIKTNTAETVDALNLLIENTEKWLKGLAEQISTINTSNTSQTVSSMSGHAQENRSGVQQAAKASVVIDKIGLAEAACPYISTTRGLGPARSRADEIFEQNLAARMSEINNNAGSTFENGLMDGLRKIFDEQTTALCDPAGNGGDNAAVCSGDGTNRHLTISTVLHKRNIMSEDGPKVKYLDTLLTNTRTHLSVNPDLLEGPNTEAKALFVLSDRLKTELSIFDSIFGRIKANNSNTGASSKAIENLRQMLKGQAGSSGGDAHFVNQKTVDALVPEGASYMGQLEAMVVGMMNPNFYRQQALSEEIPLLASILFNISLNNQLQLEQMKLLEAIALSTSATVVVNREEALDELNGRIQAINARQ